MSGRFDYVKYDEQAADTQVMFKGDFEKLEKQITMKIKPGRAQSLALTSLEECYMWIGKGIRDDQLTRNSNTELQEGRTNS